MSGDEPQATETQTAGGSSRHAARIAVLTIGHGSQTVDAFLARLRQAGATAVADVRSTPYSRRNPQFDRETLQRTLQAAGIAYVHLGDMLGGRPRDRGFYCDGVADYERMAQAPEFRDGLDRVVAGARTYRIALMCAERDPTTCHRCLLVGRALTERGVGVRHLVDDGVLTQSQIEDALLALAGRSGEDLFAPRAERLALAYRRQARRHAFAEPPAAAAARPIAPPSRR
ncbi:DUF488 domain-containing protein [Rhodoplanes sp. TEM]|uniref:DUF488 domain-containing protein n=2 Tax=Rhodoplanes TaxID=29407 RepID=A0ABT5J4G6_RHOTP|nr:DUF488 domain-containing protein [Rhodoplanes tepidamans]MDC7784428.1 DUF488 domain-containing protein [Rhodoplanes tepidamans]MDC7983458.1 DUF488 domain-containing protein [Rhodoplanes sp. TEM]MDQ0356935.1 uncharacterized protein (DUF488 family) [Rhodoplanes tepidamans]